MKHKIIRITGLIASVITIIASVMYLVKKIMIPALAPFSLSIVMFSLVYSTWQLFSEGKVSRAHWTITLIIGLIAGIANIIAGISQIMVVIVK